MQPKFIAAAREPCEQLVHREFLFVRPLGNGVEQSPPSPTQIGTCFNATRRGKELSQIGIVKIGICVFVELAFARVVSFELNVEAIVISGAIFWRMYRRLACQ